MNVSEPHIYADMQQSTLDVARRARDWMFELSFPLWSNEGIHISGAFYEELSFDGHYQFSNKPILSRIRVQARQIFSFALAIKLGWQPERAKSIAVTAAHYLYRYGRRKDGLYGRQLDLHNNLLVDDTVTLYDNAFVLFCYAWLYKLSGQLEIKSQGEHLLECLERYMKYPYDIGGYREALNSTDIRLQNPHMHLVEALLAWYEATGNPIVLKMAEDVTGWVMTYFGVCDQGKLSELYCKTKAPLADNRMEAGHHYEWVWLLVKLSRLTGHEMHPNIHTLYATANGMVGLDGRIPLSHTLDGAVRESDRRCWAITEALKAHIAMFRSGCDQAVARILPALNILFSDHLDPACAGGWHDLITSAEQLKSQSMPATTGYHIYLALSELLDLAKSFTSSSQDKEI